MTHGATDSIESPQRAQLDPPSPAIFATRYNARFAIPDGRVAPQPPSMKTRQFRQLANLPPPKRAALVVEGLLAIGANVATLAKELEQCNEASADRAARLVYNAAREEAGKFLILIDVYRAPAVDQPTICRQFARAGDHLSKLVYAEMADYAIASRDELLCAVTDNRQALYLDGPNDYDWVFRNELLSERESALYVDLVLSEGQFAWWAPHDYSAHRASPGSVRLVEALLTTGLVSEAGLKALQRAWRGFDPQGKSHNGDWADRTREALQAFPDQNIEHDGWTGTAWFVADQWLMPMVQFDVEQADVKLDDLLATRKQRYEAEMMRELGYP